MHRQRFVTRCATAVAALAVAILCTGTAANAATQAPSVAPHVAAGSTAACVNDAKDFCRTAEPAHVGSGPACTPFADGNYWETTNDALGHPIGWTYANGSTPCVRVSFTARAVPTTCMFWLYVPDGHATATFTLGWTDSSGGHHTTEPVNENSVTGWSLITMNNPSNRGAVNVTSLYFQDNNGQSYPAELGWGSTNAYGIWQAC